MFRFAAVLCFCVLSSAYAEITKDEKDDLRKIIEPVAKDCMEELGIEAEDLKEMKKKKEVDPCFVACVLKASGTINSKGMYDYKPSLELAKEVVQDDKFLDEIRKIGEVCLKVNDEDVKDDCGRAKLLMECFHDNKGDMHDL